MHTSTGITIAPWLHDDAGVASDPINLLFEVRNHGDPLRAVEADLQTAGWTRTTLGDHQFIYFDNNKMQEDSQYVKNPTWLPNILGVVTIFFATTYDYGTTKTLMNVS